MRIASWFLVVLVLTILSGCVGYNVEGNCVSCSGSVDSTVVGTGCTIEEATADAKRKCDLQLDDFQKTSTTVGLAFGCGGVRAHRSVNEVAQDLLQVAAERVWSMPTHNTVSNDGTSCPIGCFTVKFTNQRTDFCAEEFPVQIEVQYTNAQGTPQTKNASASAGQTVTLVMADAGQAQGGVSAFSIRVNTSCHASPSDEDWSVLIYDSGTVSNGATLTFVLDNDDQLIDTTPAVASAPQNTTPLKPNLVPKPDPMFTKISK